MPCDSSIRRTKLTDVIKLTKALTALGLTFTVSSDTVSAVDSNGNSITFTKSGGAYSVSGTLTDLAKISKKYAEVTVREWAKRRGMAVTENDGTRITLVNRRGF